MEIDATTLRDDLSAFKKIVRAITNAGAQQTTSAFGVDKNNERLKSLARCGHQPAIKARLYITDKERDQCYLDQGVGS